MCPSTTQSNQSNQSCEGRNTRRSYSPRRISRSIVKTQHKPRFHKNLDLAQQARINAAAAAAVAHMRAMLCGDAPRDVPFTPTQDSSTSVFHGVDESTAPAMDTSDDLSTPFVSESEVLSMDDQDLDFDIADVDDDHLEEGQKDEQNSDPANISVRFVVATRKPRRQLSWGAVVDVDSEAPVPPLSSDGAHVDEWLLPNSPGTELSAMGIKSVEPVSLEVMRARVATIRFLAEAAAASSAMTSPTSASPSSHDASTKRHIDCDNIESDADVDIDDVGAESQPSTPLTPDVRTVLKKEAAALQRAKFGALKAVTTFLNLAREDVSDSPLCSASDAAGHLSDSDDDGKGDAATICSSKNVNTAVTRTKSTLSIMLEADMASCMELDQTDLNDAIFTS